LLKSPSRKAASPSSTAFSAAIWACARRTVSRATASSKNSAAVANFSPISAWMRLMRSRASWLAGLTSSALEYSRSAPGKSVWSRSWSPTAMYCFDSASARSRCNWMRAASPDWS